MIESEVKKLLLEDETILWYRTKVVNLFRGIYSLIVLLVFISLIFILLFTILSNLIEIMFTLIVYITAIGLLMILFIGEYKKRKRILKLGASEIKHYMSYDILTNKRYIRRNYTQNFGENIDFSEYPNEALYFQNDVIFLDLSLVDTIYVNRIQQDFCFWVKNNDDEFAKNMTLIYFDNEEYGKVIDVLSNIMSLEISDQGPKFIEFHVIEVK